MDRPGILLISCNCEKKKKEISRNYKKIFFAITKKIFSTYKKKFLTIIKKLSLKL